MATISAYTSDALKRRNEEIMREEGRKQAQVGSTALELYARLPAAARRAYLELAAAEDRQENNLLARVIAEVTRSLLNAKWELADAQLHPGRLRGRGLARRPNGRSPLSRPPDPAPGGARGAGRALS